MDTIPTATAARQPASPSLPTSLLTTLSPSTILTLLMELPVLYPNMKTDNTQEGMKQALGCWLRYCGHLTDAQFERAKMLHLTSQDGRFSISPQLILAARDKIAEEERVVDSLFGRAS